MYLNLIYLVLVGFLWGATNPFIRLGSRGIENVKGKSRFEGILLELSLISSRLSYWIPFLLNQLGSVLYVHTLHSASISTAVPIANSLSFLFTAVVGYMIGEKTPTRHVIIGSALVSIGTSMIIYDKFLTDTAKEFDVSEYIR